MWVGGQVCRCVCVCVCKTGMIFIQHIAYSLAEEIKNQGILAMNELGNQ